MNKNKVIWTTIFFVGFMLGLLIPNHSVSADTVFVGDFSPCSDLSLCTSTTPWLVWRINKEISITGFDAYVNFNGSSDAVSSDQCIYIFDENDKRLWIEEPGNPNAGRSGIREHLCTNIGKKAGVVSFQQPPSVTFPKPLRIKAGWKVVPQAAVWSGLNQQTGSVTWTFRTTEADQSLEPQLRVLRTPIVDEIVPIAAGETKSITWEPRINYENETMYLWGYNFFISMPPGVEADACVYVIGAQGNKNVLCIPHMKNTGDSYTTPQGVNFTEPIPYEPGEAVVGHATFYNTNNYATSFDGGAYLFVTVGKTLPPPPPPTPAPTCTLSANPTTITQGSSSTLLWTTSNASSVSINNGVGVVSLNSSTSVKPSSGTTYTLTSTGAGGTVTCSAQVAVTATPPPPPPTPPPTASTKFSLNNRIEVNTGVGSSLNIRQTAGGTILGRQKNTALGTVVGGPVFVNSLWWWNLNFDSGVDGWGVEDFLVLTSASPPPPPPVLLIIPERAVVRIERREIEEIERRDREIDSSQIATTITRPLFLGTEGDDVRALQEFLAKNKNLYPEGLITGYFGPLTERAVQRYQRFKGIVSSGTPLSTGYGRVGPATRESLEVGG